MQYLLELIYLHVEVLDLQLKHLVSLLILLLVLRLSLFELLLNFLDRHTLLRQHIRQKVYLLVLHHRKLISLISRQISLASSHAARSSRLVAALVVLAASHLLLILKDVQVLVAQVLVLFLKLRHLLLQLLNLLDLRVIDLLQCRVFVVDLGLLGRC